MRLSLHVVLCTVAALAVEVADPAQLKADLLGALDKIVLEEDARKILEPYLDDVKQLDTAVIEKVVFKQWWPLATDMISKSHLQNADLSFAVRKAVRTLKDEADELLRTLNPKYGIAQQVAPAFQWAQNDTCIFLTVKFTVRWNAPGALDVSEPAVHMEANQFTFTGLGKHSNNKYKYDLALKLFDNLSPADSTWSTGSVGKLSVTLRKKWPRKWPRLLQDKKMKIGNMHVWMETQDRLNGQLGGLSTVSHSPVTCSELNKLYCTVTDTCKMAANCSQCPGKPEPVEGEHICAGVPTQRASIAFKDADMDREELGGVIKLTKETHDFESESFVVYWGKDAMNKIDKDGAVTDEAFLGEAKAHGNDAHVNLNSNSKKPDQATHILVFSKNSFGEYPTPQATEVKDAYLPQQILKSASFEDRNGDKNHITGDLHVEKPEDDSTIDKFVIHWGKSERHRIDRRKNSTSHLADFEKHMSSYHIPHDTKIPDQATHLLVYVRNEHGEHPSPVSVKIVDALKPCQHKGDDDCPSGVTVTTEADIRKIAVQRAKSETDLVAYTLYWGRGSCDEPGTPTNGHLKYLAIQESVEYEVTGMEAPDGTTHILAFSQSKLGESKFCVSQSFELDDPRKTATNDAESASTSPDPFPEESSPLKEDL